MRRLRIALVLAAALALSAVLAACGGGGDKSGESPQTVLEEATLQGIESGDVDLTLNLSAPGPEGGKVDVALSGPFQGEGQGSLPQLAMTATAQGSVQRQEGRFRRRPDAAAQHGLRPLRRDRVRSRPDDLQLRRTDAEAGAARKRRRNGRGRRRRLPGRTRQAEGRRLPRKRPQRRQRRRRRHEHDQGQRRAQRLRRDRLAARSARKPALPQPARRRRAAALAGGNRKGRGRDRRAR